jgi:hypothetical protein
MVAIVPGSGDIEMGKTISGNEYSFYSNYNPSVNTTAEERTLYTILQQKVAYGGIESLNKSGMHSKGVVYNQQNSSMRLDGGSAQNPHVSATMADAVKWSGGRELTPVAGKPGLYQDQAWAGTPYVFVLQTPGSRTKTQTFVPKTKSTFTPTPTPIPPPVPWNKPKYIKPKKEVMKKVAQDYDLLFNSLEYTKTYQDEIDRLSMQLVEAGDDLLTNYTYESIDFLPDVDIEVKTSTGEYKNSADVFQQTDQSQYLETVIDESEASEDIQLANKLISYLEDKIGINNQFKDLLEYYGSIGGNTISSGSFKKGVPTENKVDFYIELPEEFDDLGEVEIRFDRI